MIKHKYNLIILGAGRPFSGGQHTSLQNISSESRVLDWVLQAVKFLHPKIHFIIGYQIDEIVSRYPNLHYTINPKWKSTGSAMSLLEAPLTENTQYIITYADILFREATVKELVELDADIAIAVDSKWKERYSSRTLTDIDRCEKVSFSDKQVTHLGSDISSEIADAEFIGLVSLRPSVIRFLKDKSKLLLKDMHKANLSQLLELLRKHGFSIKALDVAGGWAELNKPHDLANFILGTKAQTLHRLKEVLTLSQIEPQISFTVAEWGDCSGQIISHIQDTFKSTRLVVRSSAISEDCFDNSNAGAYTSILNVDTVSKNSIENAVVQVIASYLDNNPANQVLLQPMIKNVRISGVVFTRTLSHGAPYYVINFDDSTQSTESITSGTSRDHKTLIICRDNKVKLDENIPMALRSLLPALQEIERLLNYTSLDFEFAIGSDGTVHILQVRPLAFSRYENGDDDAIFHSLECAVSKFRNLQQPSAFVVGESAIFGIMPDWNPAEIIGTKPSRLSVDLYRYLIMDEVWATQRAEYGYRDVRPQPLLVSFSGHPYVDIRSSFNSFVPATLNDELAGRLVNFYLSRLCENPHLHDKVEFEIVPTCYAFDFQDWSECLVSKGGFLKSEIEELHNGLRNITLGAIVRIQDDLKTVDIAEKRFESIKSSKMSSLEKALALLEDCRLHGTLVFAHLARSAFVAIALLKSAVHKKVISQDAMNSFLNSIKTVAHEFTDDATGVAQQKITWDEFVDRYGHLRPGTYDITSESYGNNIEKFLKPAVEQAKNNNKHEPMKNNDAWLNEKQNFSDALSRIGILEDIDTVEEFLRSAIEGREYAKFTFTRNLSSALDCIVDYGKEFGLEREQLAHLSLGSLFDLRSGNIVADDITTWLRSEIDISKKFHKKTSKIELPPLITSESDFYAFLYPNSQPNYVGSGRVVAECTEICVADSDQDQSFLVGKILLIPQADPGFDWIFSYNVAGLITMYGGGNSHMAIRASEFGLPAAIGVGENKYSILAQSSIIELDANNRRIQVLQ